jgi:hypothetical protein
MHRVLDLRSLIRFRIPKLGCRRLMPVRRGLSHRRDNYRISGHAVVAKVQTCQKYRPQLFVTLVV